MSPDVTLTVLDGTDSICIKAKASKMMSLFPNTGYFAFRHAFKLMGEI